MIGALLLQQAGPVGHYAGSASSKTAGTTAAAGHLFRFLFSSVPQWVQIAGIVIGGPIAAIVAWQLWKRRRPIWAWWSARQVAMRLVIVAVLFIVVGGAATTGLAGYTYMMHANDFCQSCHIMDTAWNRFQVSAHKGLECHACHRQPLYVSSKELFWWVTERRMVIPAHDKVPTAVCSECHMQTGTDSTLTHIMLSAGHAVHLKSDSSALKDVQCVTCHGRDFHVFIPNNETCSQSGCHALLKVNLGAMSAQSFRHCQMCHDFLSRVPLKVTVAQAKTKLIPKKIDCTSCHAMAQKVLSFALAADPHKGNCGICHNPHTQTQPNDAFKTCAESQCHVSPGKLTAFHRGLGGHSLDQCGACHQAHSWKVNGNNCIACHKNINQDRPSVRRSGASLDPVSNRHAVRRSHSLRRHSVRRKLAGAAIVRFASVSRATIALRPRVAPSRSTRAAVDTTFRHSRHMSVTCTDCHGMTDTHGALKFTRPAGCLACHHSPQQRAQCSACHKNDTLDPRAMPMTFAISARREVVTRPVGFAHARHGNLACTACHGSDAKRPVTTTCASCHAGHHTPTADCAGCHPTARVGHTRAVHEGCAGCHTDATVAALPASRPVCLVCHQEQRNHYPNGSCATCHALADHPLLSAGRGGGPP